MMTCRTLSSHLIAFALVVQIPLAHAEINQNTVNNSIDVLSAFTRYAITTTKPTNNDPVPTEEQRVAIINAIARGAGNESLVIKQTIVDAQSSIQSVVESTSCIPDNQTPVVDPNRASTSALGGQFAGNAIKYGCGYTVYVDQWQMPSPDLLNFTVSYRLGQSDQAKTWQLTINRLDSGAWVLKTIKADIK
jgi:hypothetical protein